ncbi:MAG: single-stranded DNA-binding protein [Spirochaetaceae bacterium]|nr:MAG: single-stranded DNA-binding protein [Spirochaetaceae bacterium]
MFEIYRELSELLRQPARKILEQVRDVHTVYDPLQYAAAPWRSYLTRYLDGPRRVLFLGMNPGPWGMAQTGIPFGEVQAVREWMGIDEPVGEPENPHPARPVTGFACPRSEVSGRRLWELMAARFGTAENFFRNQAVLNFCPLVFMTESGRNVTPDRIPSRFRASLEEPCDEALRRSIEVLQPSYLVGIGHFARERLARVRERLSGRGPGPFPAPPVRILHPSPASPAANRGWAEAVTAQLEETGIW